MASGSRSGYGNWELDKGEINLEYCDVGLGLKLPWQNHHHHPPPSQGGSPPQQRQQHMGFSGVPWLHNRQNESCRVIFTAGQRQELERQTIIYKYMMSSLPVPPELLIPFSKYSSSNSPITTSSSPSEVVKMRYTGSRGGDPEPWRCRRTDGKKWRCSRDVAPDQKYCERHSHKGRPSRSRKPVEPTTTTTTTNTNNNVAVPSSVTNLNTSSCNTSFFSPYTISKPSSSPSFDMSSSQFASLSRYPYWFMKKDVTPTPPSMYPHHQLTGETTTSSHHLNDDHHQNCLLPRPFIDAWSLGDPKNATNNVIENDNSTLATNKCNPLTSSLGSILPLTLSMSAGVDLENHETEDNMKDQTDVRACSSANNQPLYWMNQWVSSPPGGPLAEALCLGMSGTSNNLMAGHSDDQLVSPHGYSTSSSTTTLG